MNNNTKNRYKTPAWFAVGFAVFTLIASDCSTVPMTGRSQLMVVSDAEVFAAANQAFVQLQAFLRQNGKIYLNLNHPRQQLLSVWSTA
jgi:hypothetical protein